MSNDSEWFKQIREIENIVVTEEQYLKFLNVLEDPPPPSEKLLEAAKRHKDTVRK